MILLQLISAFIGTVAFSILFQVRKKYFITCGFTGTIGWFVYLLAYHFSAGKMLSNFLAAVFVILLSRTFAVVKQCPITIFLIPGIFPIIPGAGIYYTAYEITRSNLDMALVYGMDTLKTIVLIALAICIVISLPTCIFKAIGSFINRIKFRKTY
jgi:uncharacterized membrane protein YjjB (DUF3815 family)